MINILKAKVQIDYVTKADNVLVTFLNPYSYMIGRNHKDSFQSFDEIYCDGKLFQLMVKLVGIRTKRASFDMTSVARTVLSEANRDKLRIALVGSVEGVADTCRIRLETAFPDLKVVYTRSGYFKADELEKCCVEIRELGPEVVIAGMGTPMQEKFLLRLKKIGWKGRGYTCGGFMHQIASAGLEYYPGFYNKYHLRWLYRMIDEPKLIKRYLLLYPKAFSVFIGDALKSRAL